MRAAVARMSEAISGSGGAGFTIDPGCRFAHPGYEEEEKRKEKRRRNAERRVVTIRATADERYRSPRLSGAAPPPPYPPPQAGEGREGAARLSAFHRGSRRPVVTVPAQLQARLPGTRTLGIRRAGVTRPFLSQSRGSTPHCGRSTAARDARSRPGAAGKAARRHRTRPYRAACRPRGVLVERVFAHRINQNKGRLSSVVASRQ